MSLMNSVNFILLAITGGRELPLAYGRILYPDTDFKLA